MDKVLEDFSKAMMILRGLVDTLAGEQESEDELAKHFTEAEIFWIRSAQEHIKKIDSELK